MSTLKDRIRARRAAHRRAAAIQAALEAAPSRAMREELLAMASRFH